MVGVGDAPVPEGVIAELPKMQVERLDPFPVSGATKWANGRWLVLLNGAEPIARQRFSVAHEFKHILDHRFIDTFCESVDPAGRRAWIEQVCDYFAGCLLMPRPWVKRAYGSGLQRLPELAEAFALSEVAMRVCLNEIGLTEPQPRCAPIDMETALHAATAAGTSGLCHRTPTLLPAT